MSRFSTGLCTVLMASTALMAVPAIAQTADTAPQASEEETGGGEIIVTGTRAIGQLAAESAAPIQLLSEEALTRVGQPNLNQALTQLVPSFQAQTQGVDMASFSLSARLRGVSANHSLLLVNGKRRHGNAILQVINGAFGGSAAPSLDLIPPDAVQRVEIFQEGAAAIYGSDAIAGVINIILKNNDSGVTAKGSVGQYYDGEGLQYSASGNIGLPVGESGFLNLTLFHRRNDYTTVGEGQFLVRNLDGTTATRDGAASGTPALSPAFQTIYNTLNARNGTAGINGGQPKSQLNILFYNFGYDAGAVEFYSFGDVSYRHGKALQGYRPPNRVCTVTTDPNTCFAPTVANGMVPLIEVKQDEFSLTNGIKGEIDGGWSWDISATYSEDVAKVFTTNSANTALFRSTFGTVPKPGGGFTGFTPRYFEDGGFTFTQFIAQADISKELEVGMAEPLTVAFGAEYRKETYEIFAGDEASRFSGGGQSFPGYSLDDAGIVKRDSKSVYLNFIAKPVDAWTVDIAGRYEDYSDFGSTTIGKITTRYDFSDAIALRATASTGFRAPSLQEQGYSANSVGPTSAVVQILPGTPASVASGFGALRPEKSTNFSIGTVLRPIPKLIVSLDGYFIKIKDRIVSTGEIRGQNNGAPVNTLLNGRTRFDIVTSAIALSGASIDPFVITNGNLGIQTYTNGIDTETKGIELSVRYPVETGIGMFDLSLGVNYSDTKVKKNRLGSLFDVAAQAIIESASPKWKSVFGVLFSSGPFTANARATYFSSTTLLFQPNGVSTTSRPIAGIYYPGTVKAAVTMDLELSYDLTESINLAVGANNLFDKMPEVPGLVADAATIPSGRSPYINNGGAINAPFNFGPYGTNGGYYYARVTAKF